MSIELSEKLLSDAAGWDVMKMARAYVAQGQVLSSFWGPPLLRGVVQAGPVAIRASMVIKGGSDIDNLCTCREAREWGKICAHGVAVGLHWLNAQKKETVAATVEAKAKVAAKKTPSLLRADDGEPAELHFILPPNFDQAAARGRVMLVIEAKWGGGRCPLNALPKGRSFAFSAQDGAILDAMEKWTDGETPAVLQLETKDFATLLPVLAEHPNITLGKSSEVTITKTPFSLPLRATLEANGEISMTLKEKSSSLAMVGDWVWRNATLQPLALPPALKEIFRGPILIPRAQVPTFLSQPWPQLQATGSLEANFKLEDFTLEPQAPKFLLELKGGLAQLSARLQCAYGSRIMTVGVSDDSDENVWLPDPEVKNTLFHPRSRAREQSALGRLQR